MEQRVAFDVEGYAQRVLTDSCFICAMQRGDPGYEHELISADDATPAVFDSSRLNGVFRFSRAVALTE